MSDERTRNPGLCMLCKEVLDKSQMTRHLKKCAIKNGNGRGKTVKLFHIVAVAEHMPEYWLHVEVSGALTLDHLDSFLRDIWLECCGHLSCFTIDGQQYSAQPSEDSWSGPPEKSMRHKLQNVLKANTAFRYLYDYGSTTNLKLRVAGVREGQAEEPGIRLLARNESLPWSCSECGEPATRVLVTGWYFESDDVLCDGCIGDYDEDQHLPLLNSPRTGVCGYCG